MNIPFTGLTPQYLCAVGRFVEISEIVDHHCLNFLFIKHTCCTTKKLVKQQTVKSIW